jgi:hypothetical protein
MQKKKKPLYTAVGEVNSTRKISREYPQKLKIKLLYDPAIPLLGIYIQKLNVSSL